MDDFLSQDDSVFRKQRLWHPILCLDMEWKFKSNMRVSCLSQGPRKSKLEKYVPGFDLNFRL